MRLPSNCLWLWVFLACTWINASPCLSLGGYSHFIRREIHYCIVEWRKHEIQSEISSRRQLLLMTQMKYESIMCVFMCACTRRKLDQCTHPCIILWWISFLPPLVTRWLSQWWRVASFCFSGGWWVGCDSHMGQLPASVSLLFSPPVHMINTLPFLHFSI